MYKHLTALIPGSVNNVPKQRQIIPYFVKAKGTDFGNILSCHFCSFFQTANKER